MNDIKGSLTGDFDYDFSLFCDIFKNDAMFRKRTVNIGNTKKKAAIMFFDGMAETKTVDDSVIRSFREAKDLPDDLNCEYICRNILYASEISTTENIADIIGAIMNGDTFVLIENSKTAVTVDTKGFRTRGVDEPNNERVLSGPKEGFNESAVLNLALIRRKLQTPDLAVESLKIGKRSKTSVFICYLSSLCPEKILSALKDRLNKIDIDGILDSNYITEHIKDGKFSVFKTVGSTERPDIAAARLLEGRIAVVVDGTPVCLTLPFLFCENFQSDEDYYVNFLLGSAKRFLRYFCFFLSIAVPAVFVSLTTYHIELLPTSFMLTVAKLRSGVPFSSLFECISLIIIFEILKETALRTPQSLNTALGIVGGLIIGQAAVSARIISAPTLIAVALSGVAGLAVPRLNTAIVFLRIVLVIASGLLGLYGFFCVLFFYFVRVFGLSSFGVDYTSSLKNPDFQKQKDILIRAPWDFMKTRPTFNFNKIRSRKND